MSRRVEDLKQMDGPTSAAVCKAVGERLRNNLATEPSALPPRLQTLLDEFQRQEDELSPHSS